jgi:ABC-type multidrug transport system ATPase subunit
MSKGKLIGEGKIDKLGRGLFGGGKYKIEVELSNTPPEIIEKIKNMDKVISVEKNKGILEITCDDDIRSQISRIIVENNILLTRMNIKDSSLEDIYLRYFKEE